VKWRKTNAKNGKGTEGEKMRKIKIFDTTLRDGEQSPGATLTHNEKILIAHQLARLNVDVIEAGFPVASEDDFRAVKEIADTVKGPSICALARAIDKDVDIAWNAIRNAEKPRIHTFMSSSDIHLKYQFKKSRKEALEMAVNAVKRAKGYCDDVEFSPMDATRSDPAFVFEMLERCIDAGATTVNIPDTVGYSTPEEYGALIKSIVENVPNISNAAISTHCHNDLGFAVANSLAGVLNGASQVECTVNGIGERAGNASMEEIAMALHTRKSFYDAETGLKLDEIFKSSQMVSNLTGLTVQRNKAVVGENAFAHESGIHQHGLLANKLTYEIMNPEMIGKKTELVLGKHSGKAAVMDALKKMGFSFSAEQADEITAKIKELADKKKSVKDEDIVAIASDVLHQASSQDKIVVLGKLEVKTGNRSKPSATVELVIDGKACVGKGEGVGPVDAVAHAIQSVIPQKIQLRQYNLKAITGGTDALADVVIRLADDKGNVFDAEAVNEDVIMASAYAIVQGYNKALNFYRHGGKSRDLTPERIGMKKLDGLQ